MYNADTTDNGRISKAKLIAYMHFVMSIGHLIVILVTKVALSVNINYNIIFINYFI